MLSVTYIPERRYTYAVLLGCTAPIREQFIQQLGVVKLFHPMVLPVLFADIQRDKTLRLSQETSGLILAKAWDIPKMPYASMSDRNADVQALIEFSTSRDMMELWVATRELRNGLQDWQTQLDEMIEHIDGLRLDSLLGKSHITCPANHGNFLDLERAPVQDELTKVSETDQASFEKGLSDMSVRIRRRLRVLREEYTIAARDCSARLELISLAIQIVSLMFKIKNHDSRSFVIV